MHPSVQAQPHGVALGGSGLDAGLLGDRPHAGRPPGAPPSVQGGVGRHDVRWYEGLQGSGMAALSPLGSARSHLGLPIPHPLRFQVRGQHWAGREGSRTRGQLVRLHSISAAPTQTKELRTFPLLPGSSRRHRTDGHTDQRPWLGRGPESQAAEEAGWALSRAGWALGAPSRTGEASCHCGLAGQDWPIVPPGPGGQAALPQAVGQLARGAQTEPCQQDGARPVPAPPGTGWAQAVVPTPQTRHPSGQLR